MDGIIQNLRQALADWWSALGEKAPQILFALIVLVLGLYLARLIKTLVERGLRYRKADPELSVALARIAQWTVIGVGVLIAAEQTGVDITAFLAGLGIIGFTIGFALQDVSKNFVAGMLLLFQQPFDLGDTIEVAGFTGTVLSINLRDTEIRTVDGLLVSIPNGDVFTSAILNYTDLNKRRLQLSFGVAYDSDLEQVRRVTVEALRAVPGVLDDPAIDFRFEAFGDFAIQLSVYYWYDERQTGYSEALDAGIRQIKQAYDKAGIEIPAPYQKIQIDSTGVKTASGK